MKIELCHQAEDTWNQFVEHSQSASIFHLHEWQTIIRRAYGHPAFYLMAVDRGRVEGVLPLVLIKSRLFGRSLVSMPFADYAGVCGGDQGVFTLLLNEAVKLGRSLQADYLQLRQSPFACAPKTGVSEVELSTEKVTMLLDLSRDPDLIWKRLPSERRNRIKRARQLGLTARWGGNEAIDEFYQVFAENMRDLGSPVHSKLFFQSVVDTLGERVKVLLIEYRGGIIGAGICLFFRDTMLIPWVSSLRHYFKQHPNMLLYWSAIEYGCEKGYAVLDLGRSSKDSGTYEFKRQWGARPVLLPWYGIPFNGGPVPSFSSRGLRDRLLISCWKRLPLTVTNYVGPWLRGSIPA